MLYYYKVRAPLAPVALRSLVLVMSHSPGEESLRFPLPGQVALLLRGRSRCNPFSTVS